MVMWPPVHSSGAKSCADKSRMHAHTCTHRKCADYGSYRTVEPFDLPTQNTITILIDVPKGIALFNT